MTVINRVLDFVLLVVVITAEQLIGILGIFFLFGVILYFLSKLTRNIFHNAQYPKMDIYATGWIGTPIHELGHAVFCLIFGHRIDEIKLFSPNSGDGSLGIVSHSYNPKNIYQSAGNFFIGAGPIILGTFTLYVLLYYLLPNHQNVSGILSNKKIESITMTNLLETYPLMLSFSTNLVTKVFSVENFSSIGFWIFLYLASCISSHMALSPSDLKGMWKGFLMIVIVLFFVNFFPTLFRVNITPYVLKIHKYTASFMSVFILATIISLLNFTISYIFLGAIYFKKYRSLLRID